MIIFSTLNTNQRWLLIPSLLNTDLWFLFIISETFISCSWSATFISPNHQWVVLQNYITSSTIVIHANAKDITGPFELLSRELLSGQRKWEEIKCIFPSALYIGGFFLGSLNPFMDRFQMPYIPPQFTTHSGLHIFIKLFVVFVGDATQLSFPDTVCCHSQALVPKASLALTLYLYKI